MTYLASWFAHKGLAGAGILCVFGSCLADVPSQDAADAGAAVDAFVFAADGGASVPLETCVFPGPCDGQIDGTWRFVAGCVIGEDAAIKQSCQAAGYELILQSSGTLTLGLDGTFALDLTTALSGRFVEPLACYPEPQRQCTNLARGSSFNWRCDADGAGGCACSVAQPPARTRLLGQYVATGAQLILDDQPSITYCVSGNNLQLRQPYIEGTLAVFQLRRM